MATELWYVASARSEPPLASSWSFGLHPWELSASSQPPASASSPASLYRLQNLDPSLVPWAAPVPSSSPAWVPHTVLPSLVLVLPPWVSSALTLSSRVSRPFYPRCALLLANLLARHCPCYYGWYHWYLRPRRFRPDLRWSQAGSPSLHWLHSVWCWSLCRSRWSRCWFCHRYCWSVRSHCCSVDELQGQPGCCLRIEE
nr:vacuolar ATPase V0 domain subunit c [Trichoderma harzianum]